MGLQHCSAALLNKGMERLGFKLYCRPNYPMGGAFKLHTLDHHNPSLHTSMLNQYGTEQVGMLVLRGWAQSRWVWFYQHIVNVRNLRLDNSKKRENQHVVTTDSILRNDAIQALVAEGTTFQTNVHEKDDNGQLVYLGGQPCVHMLWPDVI